MKRMQIYLTDSEIENIDNIIKKNGGGTKADIIRRAIDSYININKCNVLFTNSSMFLSPGIPAWSKPLPKILDIGKKAIVKTGNIWAGWSGKIVEHYINGDDCSGTYGEHTYCIEKDNKERFSVKVSDCEVL